MDERMKQLNAGTGSQAHPNLKPRDAATLIIVDSTAGSPRVLMGRRRTDQVFMPGKYVFPGGRVDAEDKQVEPCRDLRASELDKLLIDMKGRPSPARARALALAAVRETFEEAGLLIGAAPSGTGTNGSATPNDKWAGFLGRGVAPDLGALTFFARAITPPRRPRRYDTRFFCVEAGAIAERIEDRDGELLELHWLTLEEARSFDLPAITRVILEDLSDRISTGSLAAPNAPVPYYHHRNGSFRRDLLTARG